MLSQFFILSTRGDTIIKRDCKFVADSHPYVRKIAEMIVFDSPLRHEQTNERDLLQKSQVLAW